MFGRTSIGVLAVAVLTVAAATAATPSTIGAADGIAADAVGAHLVPVRPCRLADTRTGDGITRLDANTVRVKVAGRCGLPETATAAALSAVSVNATSPGFLTLYPSGILRPLASNLNYRPGQIRSNAAITRVGLDGSVDIYTSSGDVVLDTSGAFVHVGAVAAGRLVPVTPRRLLDTRQSTLVPAGGTVTIPLPADAPLDASALSLVVTVTESTGAGFVTTHPAGTARPLASSLNLDGRGQTRAAGGIHSVGPDGLTIYLSAGGHVIVDLTGWFTGDGADIGTVGTFVPVDPLRLLDTREPRTQENQVTTAPVRSGETVVVPTVASMTMAMNITSVDAEPGFITVHPAGTERPVASVLNPAGGGDVVADFGIVPTSAEGLAVYSQRAGHVVVDLAGWFTTVEHVETEDTTTTTTAPEPTTTVPESTTTSTIPSTTTTTTVPVTTTTTTVPVTTTTTSTTTTTTVPVTTTTTTPPVTTTTDPGATTTTTVAPTTTTTTIPATTTTTTTTVPSNRPVVYLTFDDGPEPSVTPQLLTMLANHGVKATFFLVGDHVTSAPTIAAQTLAAGHALGNHSWSHPDLRTLTDAQILQQLNDTSAAILAATGHQVTCMRPPYGYVDPSDGPAVTPMNTNVRNVIDGTGLTIEMWTHDSRDWEVTASTASITNVLNQMPTTPGSASNILLHDWAPFTLTAVDQWLTAHAATFEFRTLPHC